MSRAQQLQKFKSDGKAVSPERLVVLLYERLGRDLAAASEAIQAGDAQGRHSALVHAQEIIEELAYSVRTDLWPSGDGLVALYQYVLDLLVRTNISSDRKALTEATSIVGELTDAWRQAYVELAAAPSTPAASAG